MLRKDHCDAFVPASVVAFLQETSVTMTHHGDANSFEKNSAEASVASTPLLQDWSSDTASSQQALNENGAREGLGRLSQQRRGMHDKLDNVFVVEAEVRNNMTINLPGDRSSWKRKKSCCAVRALAGFGDADACEVKRTARSMTTSRRISARLLQHVPPHISLTTIFISRTPYRTLTPSSLFPSLVPRH